MDQFQVGDKVWCCARGQGEVVALSSESLSDYPVTVAFADAREYYTAQGQMYRNAPRCLFFTAPDTTGGTTRPFVPKLIGKYVVVRCAVGKDILGVIEDEAPNWVRVDNIILQKEDIETLYEVSEKNLLED